MRVAMYTAICLVFFIQLTFVSAEKGTCPEGYYGEICDLECSQTCRPLETYPCNKETGKCAEGCKSGYFGETCERKCNCSETCIQETGACIGNQNATPRPQDQNEKGKTCAERKTDVWMIVAIILIVVIVVLVVTFLGFILRKRLFRKQKKSSGDEMKSLIKTKQRQSSEHKGLNRNDDYEVLRLKNERKRIIAAYNWILRHNGLLPDSAYYHLEKKRLSKDIWLQCPPLQIIKNTDGDGNYAEESHSELTAADDVNLSTTISFKHTEFPQYFELDFNINVNKPLEETEFLFEIKFCSEKNKDQPNNACLKIALCSTCQKQNICLLILDQEKSAFHQPTSIQNIKDYSSNMKLGVLFTKRKLSFFINRTRFIGTLSWPQDRSGWSIRGLSIATCSVQFVSGFDIEMTSEMLAVIKPRAVK